MTVRTRFAPSPTGNLHIGSARTALFSWLYARHHNGQFILRIEDTDQERSTQESTAAIIEAMAWMGLDADEGPFHQMARSELYQKTATELLSSNKAYRCYCTKERLNNLREEQIANKQKPRYDGHCRHLKPGDAPTDQPFVIRLRTPQEGTVTFSDAVHGSITTQNNELDDLVLVRSDGVPTYNFSVVVDDLDMHITHVIRGDDHINNTPRQIHLFEALGVTPPQYVHTPTILGPDGKRLSKRHGATNLLDYRDEGYLPQALLNYLVRLGWSHGDQEVFSLEAMIQLFDVSAINKAAAAFNPEKLLWLNQQHIKQAAAEEITPHLMAQFKKLKIDTAQGPALTDIFEIQKERAKTLKEMAESSAFFYTKVSAYDEKAVRKNIDAETPKILQTVYDALDKLTRWEKESIHQVMIETGEKFDIKLGKIAQPLRIAITGNTISPPIDITLALLGKTKTLSSIEKLLSVLQK